MATYLQIYNSVGGDGQTRARAAVACAKYARYLLGLTPAPSATKLAWAQAAAGDAPAAAAAGMWGIVGDPQYLADGPAITDLALQTAVETVINSTTP